MNVTFQKAKNGENTALIGNLYLHSSYNPQKEAQRFVENIQAPFLPDVIILIEPCLSYILGYLRKRFPNTKIGAIRFSPSFNDFNSDFDFVLNYFSIEESFSQTLLNYLGEEKLLTTLFLSWEPAAKAFPEQNNSIWHLIKSSLENARTLLITRQYFEKKWLTNSFNFFSNITNTISLEKKIDLPVLIIASGFSFTKNIHLVKDSQNCFFIICLSSALKVCLENNIKPDLVLSTDGGYWAGQHLKSLNNSNIPLGITPESYCPKSILKNNLILPLNYTDGLSSLISSFTNISFLEAKRNGTISGTALEFAVKYFTTDIYFMGLDLANHKGFQHAQDNELELNNTLTDNRINTRDKRLYRSECNSSSMEIYLNWFISYNNKNRKIYRVIETQYRKNDLHSILDIDLQQFTKITSKLSISDKKDLYEPGDFTINRENFNNFLNTSFFENSTKQSLYPLEYVYLKHDPENSEIIKRIEKNHKLLYKKLWKIING